MKKKAWKKPALIALVRGKPEERVLQGCKGAPPNISPNFTAGPCGGFVVMACVDCAEITTT